MKRGGEGAEVLRSVVPFFSGQENTGKGLFLDDDPGVGLVVFQQNVVAGLILFDQTVLQMKGVLLGVNGGELDLYNPLYQLLGFF